MPPPDDAAGVGLAVGSTIATDPKALAWWGKLAEPWPLMLRRNLALLDARGRDAMLDAVSRVDVRLEELYTDTVGPRAPKRLAQARLPDVLDLPALSGAGTNVSDLRPLRPLSGLRALNLSSNPKLKSIAVVEHFPALESLALYHTKVTKLEPVAALPGLRQLLCAGSRIRSLEPVRHLTELRRLHAAFLTAIDDLAPLEGLSKLEELDLDRGRFTDLSPLRSLSALRSLNINRNNVTELEPLSALGQLERLDIGSTLVCDLRPLLQCSRLRALVCDYTQTRDLSPLASMHLHELECSPPTIDPVLPIEGLQRLRIHTKNLGDLDGIQTLAPSLTHLDLGSTKIASLEPIGALTKLQSLCLEDPKIKDLRPLASLHRLQTLELTGTKIADLSPLAGMTDLRELEIGGTRVTDLSPLAACKELRMLVIRDMQVDSLDPLHDLPNLELLVIDERQNTRHFRRQNPHCKIGH